MDLSFEISLSVYILFPAYGMQRARGWAGSEHIRKKIDPSPRSTCLYLLEPLVHPPRWMVPEKLRLAWLGPPLGMTGFRRGARTPWAVGVSHFTLVMTRCSAPLASDRMTTTASSVCRSEALRLSGCGVECRFGVEVGTGVAGRRALVRLAWLAAGGVWEGGVG